jgi:hypothetical protein
MAEDQKLIVKGVGPMKRLICPECEGTEFTGVEYAHPHPERYDGVSEWVCNDCLARFGRWTRRRLHGDEIEYRFGNSRVI